MSNPTRLTTRIAVLVTLAGCAGLAMADDADVKNLSDFSCKEVMRFSTDHRDVAVALLHGYYMGKAGTTTFNSDELAARTDKFIDYCLDHPTARALDSMARVSK